MPAFFTPRERHSSSPPQIASNVPADTNSATILAALRVKLRIGAVVRQDALVNGRARLSANLAVSAAEVAAAGLAQLNRFQRVGLGGLLAHAAGVGSRGESSKAGDGSEELHVVGLGIFCL